MNGGQSRIDVVVGAEVGSLTAFTPSHAESEVDNRGTILAVDETLLVVHQRRVGRLAQVGGDEVGHANVGARESPDRARRLGHEDGAEGLVDTRHVEERVRVDVRGDLREEGGESASRRCACEQGVKRQLRPTYVAQHVKRHRLEARKLANALATLALPRLVAARGLLLLGTSCSRFKSERVVVVVVDDCQRNDDQVSARSVQRLAVQLTVVLLHCYLLALLATTRRALVDAFLDSRFCARVQMRQSAYEPRRACYR